MGRLHSLTRSNVRQTAPKQIGVYKLYNSRGGPVRYVGSSENLRQRLLGWASENDYRFFEYEYADTRGQAYKREANLTTIMARLSSITDNILRGQITE